MGRVKKETKKVALCFHASRFGCLTAKERTWQKEGCEEEEEKQSVFMAFVRLDFPIGYAECGRSFTASVVGLFVGRDGLGGYCFRVLGFGQSACILP